MGKLFAYTFEHLHALNRYSRTSLGGVTHKIKCIRHRCFMVPRESIPTILIELPGKIHERTAKVLEWRQWARDQAKIAVENRTKHIDDPSLENLLVEIYWLVQDNISKPDGVTQRFLKYVSMTASIPKTWENSCLRLSLDELSLLWTRRLLNRVPLQYLTNMAYWRDLTLVVTPAVLIPRPETEMVIDFALEARHKYHSSCVVNAQSALELQRGAWLDLGTGSGAIAIALAHSFITDHAASVPPIYAVDVSPEACSIAEHNVKRYRLQQSIHIVQGSWFRALDGEKNKNIKFAGIVSNQPYIPKEDLDFLQPEVQHEPALALDGGCGNGLDSLHEICMDSKNHLMNGGILILETHGDEQVTIIEKVLRDSGLFTQIEVRNDCVGVKRFVISQRRFD